LLNAKLNREPYSGKPEFSKIFELMHKVFPAKLNSANTGYEVEKKPYYVEGDANYMCPTNNNKSGNKKG